MPLDRPSKLGNARIMHIRHILVDINREYNIQSPAANRSTHPHGQYDTEQSGDAPTARGSPEEFTSPLPTVPRIQSPLPISSQSLHAPPPMPIRAPLSPIPFTYVLPPDGFVPYQGQDNYIHLPPPYALSRPPPIFYPGLVSRRTSSLYRSYSRIARPGPTPIQPPGPRVSVMDHGMRPGPSRASSWNTMPFSLVSYTVSPFSILRPRSD